MIVAEELLKPITDEAPCGEDLSYDASLQELETMARGKEETQFSAAEAPNWKKVQDRCLQLFGRSKDLRIVMTLAVSSLELDGLPGFREILFPGQWIDSKILVHRSSAARSGGQL